MNKIICLLVLLCCSTLTMAQPITESKEWKDLITNLENESWPDAHKLTIDCLNKIKGNEQEEAITPLLRYMFIFTESGLMNMNKVSKDDALKAVKGFEGQFILLPAHPVHIKFARNSIQMHNDKTDTLFLACTNSNGTDLFSFEYVILKDKWPIEDFKNAEGKNYRLGGTLTRITVEGNMLPRFKMMIDHGEYKSFD